MYKINITAESRALAMDALREVVDTLKDKNYKFAYDLSGQIGYTIEIVCEKDKKVRKCR